MTKAVGQETRMREYPHVRVKIPAIPALREAGAGAGLAISVRVSWQELAGFLHLGARIPANAGGICYQNLGVSCQVNTEMRATLLPEGLKVHAGELTDHKSHHNAMIYGLLNAQKS